jgi:hypothetical protein
VWLGPLLPPALPREAWRLGFPPSSPGELAASDLLLAAVTFGDDDHQSAGQYLLSGHLPPGR